jgi:hypothetical protein
LDHLFFFYISILVSFIYLALLYHLEKGANLDRYFVINVYLVINFIVINSSLNLNIGVHHVLIFIYLYLYYLIKTYRLEHSDFLKINNIHFTIYSVLSFLVYYNIIGLNRELNEFEIFDYDFIDRTLIGFYGSTASLDSYALFTMLVNLVHNKSKISKYVISAIALVLSLLTFRYTPIIAVSTSLLIYLVLKSIRIREIKLVLNEIIIILISTSFILVYVIIELLQYKNLETYFIIATNGRSTIWINMNLALLSEGWFSLKAIFGLSDVVTVNTYWSTITNIYSDNPHNSYLNIFSRFGMLGLIAVTTILIKYSKLFMNQKEYVIFLFVIITAVTNTGIFFYQFIIMVMYIMIRPYHKA